MKKGIPIVLLLAAVAAAVIYFLRPGRNADLAPGFAAKIAPADAMIFLEAPNIPRTLERWKKNGFYLISQDPEWQEFIAKWDAFAAANPSTKAFFGVYDEIQRADPGGLFMAMDKDVAAFPKLVGGFPYRGKKSAVESVIRKLKEQLLVAWPGAKSELDKHGDIEIETITSATGTPAVVAGKPFYPKVHLAFRDNWFFFATDRKLLVETLDRYLGKPEATPGLVTDPLFQETLTHGNAEPEFVVWARGPETIKAVGDAGFTSARGFLQAIAGEARALLYSWKLDGAIMRDRVYVHLKEAPKVEPSEHRSLGLTGPLTYAYLELNYPQFKLLERAAPLFTGPGDALAKAGLTPNDIGTAFGPELAITSAWPDGVISRMTPDFFAAVEVRDSVKARKFAELIAGSGGGGMTVKTEGAVTRWDGTEALLPIGPYKFAMALTERHLMFGITSAAVDTAIQQFAKKAPNLATKPGSAYAATVQGVNAPHGGLLYVDTKMVFERLYGLAKPTIAMQLATDPAVSKYFDAGKLPQESTISQHLTPMVVSLGTDGPGWLVESTGPLTLTPVLPVVFFGVAFTPSVPGPTVTSLRKADTDLRMLAVQLGMYKSLAGVLPTTAQGLQALVSEPTSEPKPTKWQSLRPNLPVDDWGKPYQYRQPGTRNKDGYDLFSNGPDGLPDTGDDIGNWSE